MSNTFVDIEYVKPMGLTSEAGTLTLNLSNAVNIYIGTSVCISRKFENQNFRKFLGLKNKWKSETFLISSGSLLVSNAAYQDIIGLGYMAIPWIVRELRKTNDHWFYALEKITGENPIKKENIGKVEAMKNDWVDWASKHNFV